VAAGAPLLALDAGTSAVRAVAIDLDGTVLGAAAEPMPPPARGTIDPAALWRAVRRAVARLEGARDGIAGVGVSGQLGLVLVDAAGEPVLPALAWSDRRAVDEAAALELRCGADLAAAGRRADAELWAPKLLRLRRHEPDALRRARWALSLKDWLVLRLTGEAAIDETHASYTLLFDVRERAWSAALVEAAEVDPGLLPPVRRASERAGALTPVAARELGLVAGLPVAVGGPDGTLGVVGAGGVRAGVTVDVAGTTDVLAHVVDAPVADPDLTAVLNAHAVPERWTVGGPTGMTGGAAAWLARLLGLDVRALYERWGAAADALPAGAAGLTAVTALTGGRFPHWRPETAGAIRGIAPGHTPAHLLRAIEEGAAFLIRDGLERLAALGCPADRVVVAGGAARPAALQLRADAWGVPVAAVANPEASALGAAALAAVAAGLAASVETAVAGLQAAGRVFEPDPARHVALEPAYERWRSA
jgi:sugar (pentulose or hexulose) kinase